MGRQGGVWQILITSIQVKDSLFSSIHCTNLSSVRFLKIKSQGDMLSRQSMMTYKDQRLILF